MSHQGGVSQWIAEVSSRFGVLTPAQARVLAYWSYGMVLTQSCGLTTVAIFLTTLLGTGYDAQRHQVREWCYEASASHRCWAGCWRCGHPVSAVWPWH